MDHMSLRGVPYPLVLDSRTASRSTEPKMERRTFLGTVGFSVLAAPLAAHAQQAGKVYRVGVLWFNSLQVDAHLLEAFRRGLREFVGVEERNIVLEFRSAEVNPERLPGLVAELVRLKADVIVADTTVAIRAAMRGTTSIPIVLAIAADPVGSGLVPSLAHPGGNVTGALPHASGNQREAAPRKSFRRSHAWLCSGTRTHRGTRPC